jgi:VCBS repeat-containing protein
MSGAHQANSRSTTTSRKKGTHRIAPKPSRQPYNWLGVSAVTLGLGAAMASGTGIANAKSGAGSPSSSSNNSSSNNSSPGNTTNSHHTSTSDNAHKHPKKAKASDASDSSGASDSSAATTPSSANTSAADTGGTTTKGHTGKGKKAKAGDTSQTGDAGQTKTKVKVTKQAAATASTATDTSYIATPPATPMTATKSAAKLVPLAATQTINSAASTDTTTTTSTATTLHATSSNAIVAAIQNAMISFFTATSTIAQLAANGLTGPVVPAGNPVGAFIYSIFRGMEQFAGLVPTVGTPTTNSEPATGTVTGNLNVTVPAGGPTLTYSVYTNPLFGSVSVNTDGTYTYKSNVFGAALAALGLNPTDKFTVTASDGVASTNVTVNVAVLSANDTPSTPVATNITENTATGVVTGTLSSTSPDGESVAYNVVTRTIGGSISVDSATGSFTYTPTAAYRENANLGVITTDTFTVTATNAAGNSSLSGFITVPVSPAANDTPSSPTATNVSANAVTGVVTGTITSTDPAGANLTYSATQPIGGTLTLNNTTGVFSYTPTALNRADANLGVITTDTFSVTASNGSYSATSLITVPVEPATNDTPSTPTSSSLSVNSTTGVVTGTIDSTSPDGSALTYHVTALPTQGTISVSGNTYTYTPSALAMSESAMGLITTDVFSVTATNAAGYSSGIGYITVPVASSSDHPTAPVVTNQTQNLVTGVVTGTITSIDPANQSLTYSVSIGPIGGNVTLDGTTGNFTYTPTTLNRQDANLGVIETDSFTVTATNGKYSSSAIVTVPVSPASNDTPSTPTSSGQNENIYTGVVTGTVAAGSPDGSPVSYSITTPTIDGMALSTGSISINAATGAYTYTPTAFARSDANLGVITSDSFTVTATNAAGYSSSTSITVPISPASNNTPSAPTVTNEVENTVTGAVTGTFASTSPDGSAVTYSYTQPVQGSLSIDANGNFTYTPTALARNVANQGVITTDTFTVTASNGMESSSVSWVTVPVSPASNNTPSVPVASNISVNSTTGVVTGTLTSTSPDGATVTYSTLSLPTQGSVTISGNTFTYAPSSLAQFESQITLLTTGKWATDTFGVTASNGQFSSGMSSVTVGISPVSDTPGNPTVSNITENTVTGVVTGTLSANDPAGLALTYGVNTGAIGGSVTITGNTFSYTPTTLERSIAISGVTTDTFTVTATNGYYSSGATFVTVPVSPASNDTPSKPTTSNLSQNIYTGVVTGTLSSSTPDNSALTYTVTTPTIDGMALSTGSITISGNTFTYTPTAFARSDANLGVITSDTFTVTATNAAGITSGAATVTVSISPASNDTPSKPTTSNLSQNIYTGVVTGTLSATSPDGGAVTYTVTTPTIDGMALSTGSITISGNTFTYTPTSFARSDANLGVITSDTFTVTATNAQGFTGSSATVTVPISPASNDAPSKATVSGQVQNKSSGVVTGTLNATSPDGSAVSYSITTGTIGGMSLSTGSVTLSTTTGVTTFTFTPTSLAMSNSTFLGPYTDTFIVTVSNGMTSTNTTITVPILAKSLL